MKKNWILSEKSVFIVIGLLWLFVQSMLYFHYGFVTNFEGLKYQNDAKEFIDSFQLNTDRLFYSIYPIIIATILKLRIGLYGVLVFQLIINAWATYRFYCIARKLFSNMWIAIYATCILILTFQIQIWNFHLYTESLFISGLIIYTYRLITINFFSIKHFIYLGILVLILSFVRPTGMLLIIPTLVYFIFRNKEKSLSFYRISPWALAAIAVVIVHILYSAGQFYEFVYRAWNNYWVIWAYSGFNDSFVESTSDTHRVIKLLSYRKLYFFSMLRPYYSDFHNLLMMTFYPVYVLAFIGIIPFWRKNKAMLLFVVTLIAVFSMFSILTFINWHGRFIAPILPFFILLSGAGIQFIFKNKFAK